jgi:hypothetical protein
MTFQFSYCYSLKVYKEQEYGLELLPPSGWFYREPGISFKRPHVPVHTLHNVCASHYFHDKAVITAK